jgi:hypothetical protein
MGRAMFMQAGDRRGDKVPPRAVNHAESVSPSRSFWKLMKGSAKSGNLCNQQPCRWLPLLVVDELQGRLGDGLLLLLLLLGVHCLNRPALAVAADVAIEVDDLFRRFRMGTTTGTW